MGSVSVSSCRYCMFVSCVHPVAVLNAAFCMTANAGRGCKGRPYGRGILQNLSHNCLVGRHECLLLFTPFCLHHSVYTILFTPFCLHHSVYTILLQ